MTGMQSVESAPTFSEEFAPAVGTSTADTSVAEIPAEAGKSTENLVPAKDVQDITVNQPSTIPQKLDTSSRESLIKQLQSAGYTPEELIEIEYAARALGRGAGAKRRVAANVINPKLRII